jgi:hypothetical protein
MQAYLKYAMDTTEAVNDLTPKKESQPRGNWR